LQPPFDSRQPNGTGFEVSYFRRFLSTTLLGALLSLQIKDDPNFPDAQESIIRRLKDRQGNPSVKKLAMLDVWRPSSLR
jgi:hypothetical protein